MERDGQWRRATQRDHSATALRPVLRWLIKLPLLIVLTGLRHRRPTAVVLIAAFLLWFVGSGSAVSLWLTSQNAGGNASAQRFSTNITTLPPSNAAEQYLLAQSRYDAQAMWDSLDDTMKRSAARSGAITLQRLEQQVAEAKLSGTRFEAASYVGGHVAPDGTGFYFYVVVARTGAETRYIPYSFTTSQEDKILWLY